jgi:hypothetical protein
MQKAMDMDFFCDCIQIFEIYTNLNFPFFLGTTTIGDNQVVSFLGCINM